MVRATNFGNIGNNDDNQINYYNSEIKKINNKICI